MKLAGSPDTGRLANLDDLPSAEDLPPAKVAIRSLTIGDSPRRSGQSLEHIQRLVESGNSLPPIVVHRPTMQVLDGIHRLQAAVMRGQEEIDVRWFDGDDAGCFVLAVRANVTHGLPLTLADRKAAAARIVSLYPEWSDRMIGLATGLAAKTVAAERPCLAGGQQPGVRIGRDGRSRPVDGQERRVRAAKLITDNPSASLREVARAAGVSPETVRGVRARLRHHGESDTAPQPSRRGKAGLDAASVLQALQVDPAVRSNEKARFVMRTLASVLLLEKNREQVVQDLPPHCLSRLAAAAGACAPMLEDLASYIRREACHDHREYLGPPGGTPEG
jgi:transposase